MRVGIIGCGAMGGAMARAIMKSGEWTLVVFDRNATARTQAQAFGAVVVESLQGLCAQCMVIVIAVKPQQSAELFNQLRGALTQEHTVISIMAGVAVATIRRTLGVDRVVRAMPNTPAKIGEAMTVWMATDEIQSEEKKQVRSLLETFGKEMEVDNEEWIDKATAVSGSGPAYIFLLAEALEESAAALGFSPEQARTLVTQTLAGSSLLYKEGEMSPAKLREMVTSPGGTTHSAMEVIEPEKFIEVWKQATKAAYERARELAGK